MKIGIIDLCKQIEDPRMNRKKVHKMETIIYISTEIVPSGFSSDEDDDEDEEPAEETEASPEEVLQYAWETVCYVIWGKASAKGGQKVLETAPGELKELYEQVFLQL